MVGSDGWCSPIAAVSSSLLCATTEITSPLPLARPSRVIIPTHPSTLRNPIRIRYAAINWTLCSALRN
jgi:hypothetical protein